VASSGRLRGPGVDAFFPSPSESAATATAFCERCEVRAECLETALADPHTAGIWGGVSERGRRMLRKKDRAA
jgi:WhiB family redox-sensing transcriptional regulator